MNTRDDFIGTYSIASWDPGGQGLPPDLFPVNQALAVTAKGDWTCQLIWPAGGSPTYELTLRWSAVLGGVLIGHLVELEGAGTLLVDVVVTLEPDQRLLGGSLVSSGGVTGGPGTFAAQSPLPPR